MSIRSVEKSIKQALVDNKLTKAEADSIIAEAQKGPVTTGEARKLADLYERGEYFMPNTFPPGALPQPRPPQYESEPEAKQALMNFFVAEKVPAGVNYAPMRDDIIASLADVDRDAVKLDAAPKTHNLHRVLIADKRTVDGPREDAYVDTQKQEMFLKVTGSGHGGPQTVGPFWYGPIPLKEQSPSERVQSKIDTWTLARDIHLDTTRTHTPRVTDIEDLGNGEYAVTLAAINWQDPNDVRDSKRVAVDADGAFLRLLDSPVQGTGGLRADRLDAMKDAFARERGNLTFSNSGMPLGVRYERVLLEKEPGFDTYSYYALIPAGALVPGAPPADLNAASSIFIERQGGFAGITAYAGPVDL